ncbi:MAG TPA: flagellar biosynthesis protein FliL [Chromatiales bacterium]|nr:flagellar biosynthesis protein FliL [Chromatiales bacterium]
MAKKDKKDDLDLGEEKKGSKLKLILIVVGALVLFGAGGGVAYFMFASGEDQAEGEQAQEEKVEEPKAPAIYHAFDPVFVANLEGRPRLLQVGIQVRVRDPALDEFLTHNDPMIRHHILSLLSAQDGKQLKQRDAKEKLQAELLNVLQKIVEDHEGPGEVEALFFTSFVLQ